MDGLCSVTTCVNYDDILAITLPRNVKHFRKCVVVTSYEDERTAKLVYGIRGAQLFRTDAFTRNGAFFNKGAAIEEAFDVLGRSGWILLVDADILLPQVFEPELPDKNVIYGAHRYQLPEGSLDFGGDWTRWKWTWESPTEPPAVGYFQLFHADATVLQSRPWYPTHSVHAALEMGFTDKFSEARWLPDPVLHIGAPAENWFGRATSRLDGEPVLGAEQNRILMGELLLDIKWPLVRPDLQELALAARQAIR